MTYVMPETSLPRAKKQSGDDWLSRKEAAFYLAKIGCPISVRALELRGMKNNSGNGPSFIRIGQRTVRYRRGDLDAWAYRQTVMIP